MATIRPSPIPFPLSSFPGANPQESAGRLINCYAEPLGDPQGPTGPALQVWRRSPGLSQHAATAQTGYRGGLIVANLSYETWSGQAATVDAAGAVTLLGAFPGTKKVSIARNQNGAGPDVVAVDIDNGAYVLSGGPPTFYNGGGNLPQPKSVCFQDGYFFFGLGDCRVFASGINALTQNSQTFTAAQSKADVILQRVIAYAGLLFIFTTGGCEVWQNAANPSPGFPYSRLQPLPFGLVQENAIAGWETGFDDLLWAAQDYGVYRLPWGSLAPVKVSPPDLDRAIATQVRLGNTLESSCYMFAGKKFWTISSPAWSWEFNLGTGKWNERWSLISGGSPFGRWRATGGHPAFGKWLMGDTETGNLLYIDDQNYTDNGAVQLFRIESGPVDDFPNQMRIARADFDFDMGVGIAARALTMTATGAAAGTGGVVRLSVYPSTAQVNNNDTLNVSGVGGTIEANGAWPARVVDATHVELVGCAFASAYLSGGTVVDVTSPPNAIDPKVAIALSKDGGLSWGNPLIRSLGQQSKSKRARASVKSMGLSGPMGCRWRLDVTDPVYTGFLKAMQSSDPREIGA